MNSTGMTEFTPLVHDGIMFLWNYGELIQALDARNGNLLWRYRQTIPADYSRDIFYRTKRSLAIGGNKLIVPTTDMHLIALDIKTGEVVWDVVTDDFKKSKRVYNGGPLVVKDKVIMGASGCAPGGVELLRHRPRPGDRQGAVAVQHRGAARRTGQRDLERRAAGEAVGRVGVDSAELRPGAEPGLHRGRLAVPVVVGRSRHLQPERRRQERRQPVHELDAGPQPRHRQAGLALPAPAERHLRSGLRLRARHRAGAVAGRQAQGGHHRRQARGHRSARRRHRPVPVRQGSRRAEHLHLQRGNRRQDADGARAARRHPALPEQQRRAELPGRVVRPQHQPLLPVDQRRLHAARPATCPTGWSASISPPASSPWTSSRG